LPVPEVQLPLGDLHRRDEPVPDFQDKDSVFQEILEHTVMIGD
jgi:hypothetical protein